MSMRIKIRNALYRLQVTFKGIFWGTRLYVEAESKGVCLTLKRPLAVDQSVLVYCLVFNIPGFLLNCGLPFYNVFYIFLSIFCI